MNKRSPNASENLGYKTSLGTAFGKLKTALQIFSIESEIANAHFDYGLKQCNVALKREPKNAKLWILKSECLSHLDRDDEALRCAMRAHEIDPKNLDIKLDYAQKLCRAGQFARSANIYNEALEDDPDDEDALLNQSFNLIKLKDYKKAFGITTKCLKKNPEDFDFMVNHAEALLALGKFSKAKTTIEKVLRNSDDIDSDDWSILAEAEIGLKNGIKAQQGFSKALDLNPKNDRAIHGIIASNIVKNLNRMEATGKGPDAMFTDKSGRKHFIEYKKANRRKLMEHTISTSSTPIFERIDVPNLDDKIVLRDYMRNRIIEIDLPQKKGKKPKCLFCDSIECEHTTFLFTLSDIYKTLNRKHNVEQPKSILKI